MYAFFLQYKRRSTTWGTGVFHFAAQGARQSCGATRSFYGHGQEAPFVTIHWLVY